MKLIINNRRTRYIVPFSYNTNNCSLVDITDSITGLTDEFGGKFVHDEVRANEQDVYQYVLDSFSEIDKITDKNSGSLFRYEKSSESAETGLLDLVYFNDQNENAAVYFSIIDMGLFLFNSGIGFLWYELGDSEGKNDFSAMRSEDVIRFNNHFKELNYDTNLKRIKAVNADIFSMGDYISRILRNISGVRYYGFRKNILNENSSPKFVPDKALIFNYVHINKNVNEEAILKNSIVNSSEENEQLIDWKRELVDLAFYLSKGYTKRYEVLEGVDSVMYRPFNNVVWYVCKEGAGYYVVSDNENNNRKFFAGGMHKKIMDDYFIIYMMVLHQSYTMLLFAEEIAGKLPSSSLIYTEGINNIEGLNEDDEHKFKRIEETLGEIVTKVNVFVTKSVRASISYVGHQNEFFKYAKEQLSVKQDVDNVTHGLESLQEIIHDSRQNWEDIQEKKRDDKLNFIIGILSIVAFVSAIYDGLSLINDFFLAEESYSFSGSIINSVGTIRFFFYIFVLVFIGVMIGVGRITIPKIDEFFKTAGKKIKNIFKKKHTDNSERGE